jgi:hypothetical protein
MDARVRLRLILASTTYAVLGLALLAAWLLADAAPYTPPAGCTGACPSGDPLISDAVVRDFAIAMVVSGASAAYVLWVAAGPAHVLTRLEEARILESIERRARRD